jgi:uncharacterized protein (TIGR03086 family)
MSYTSLSDLERALYQAHNVLSGISPSQFSESTPCAKWSVKDLSNHLVSGALMFGMVTRGETLPDVPNSTDYTSGDLVSSFDAARQSILAAWEEPGVEEREMNFPFATLPAEMAARVELLEVLTHTWDLAHATGQDALLDDSLAENVLDFAGALVPDAMRNAQGEPFGFAIVEADSAPPYVRLAGLMGRRS